MHNVYIRYQFIRSLPPTEPMFKKRKVNVTGYVLNFTLTIILEEKYDCCPVSFLLPACRSTTSVKACGIADVALSFWYDYF